MTILEHEPTSPTQAARRAAAETGRRLMDAARVERALQQCGSVSQYPFSWGGASLSAGPLGTSMLLRELARDADRSGDPAAADAWRTAAHEQLVTAVASTRETPLADRSTMSGSAGVLLALLDALDDDGRYETACARVALDLATVVEDAPSWRAWEGLRDSDYDLLTGASGVLVVLALAQRRFEEPLLRRAARLVCDDLEWLCRPVQPHGRRPWWIRPSAYPGPEYHDDFPHGYVNLGTAHGVPGVLVALSTAVATGVGDDATAGTVRDVADYLLGLRLDEHGHDTWPMGVPLDEDGDESRSGLAGTRRAWCYGAPGVVSALLRAGEALDDEQLRASARRSARTLLEALAEAGDDMRSPTLCHGLAGLVVLACDTAGGEDAGHRDDRTAVEAAAAEPLRRLLARCSEDHLLVVRDHEPPDADLDNPGLLTGAAGVGLALLAPTGAPDALWRNAFGTARLR